MPFGWRTVKDSSLTKGVVRVKQRGREGVRVKVYRVTLTNGSVTRRELLKTVVVHRPVPLVRLQGTKVSRPKPQKACDPNYSGACVPIASDVDCGGGSGNGPAYVHRTVKVVGSDIYGLDADGNGFGCD